MQISPRQFPHPVFSHFADDLVQCEYQSAVKISNTASTYQFDVTAKTSSKDLNNLLNTGKACHAIHIECSRTRYRDIFKWTSDTHQFHVQANLLDGKVQVSRFIVAADTLDNYTNSNFHSDYKGIAFRVKKGDILALNPTYIFDADKEIDPLKSIPSIFRIKVSKMEDAPPMELDLDSHKINIYLSEGNYRNFKILQQVQSLRPVLSQVVIVPALISVLEKIMKSDENDAFEFEDLRWYKVMVKKLKEKGVAVESSSWPQSTVALAQQLIGDPISLSLDALKNMEEE